MTFSRYLTQPMACEPDKLDGLSRKLIASHYDNNYSGAVKRLNSIRAELAQLDWVQAPGFKVGALKREELIAANSAFLHELYFDGLGQSGALKPGGLSVAFSRDFGSFERWGHEFKAIGKALGGGSGWALCSWSTRENRLINHWSADHTHMLNGATPILALDMYEHSYHIDFGSNAAEYVEVFMRNIDWEKANTRYAKVLEHATSQMSASPEEVLSAGDAIHIVDVRRAAAYQAAKEVIAGATWQDPENVDEWSKTLPATKPVVVYCVYGHEVGQSTTAILRANGIHARFLEGGIYAWKAAGRPLQGK